MRRSVRQELSASRLAAVVRRFELIVVLVVAALLPQVAHQLFPGRFNLATWRDADTVNICGIRPGMTQAEVTSILGTPGMIEGAEWTYWFGALVVSQEQLEIFFNPAGRVRSVGGEGLHQGHRVVAQQGASLQKLQQVLGPCRIVHVDPTLGLKVARWPGGLDIELNSTGAFNFYLLDPPYNHWELHARQPP